MDLLSSYVADDGDDSPLRPTSSTGDKSQPQGSTDDAAAAASGGEFRAQPEAGKEQALGQSSAVTAAGTRAEGSSEVEDVDRENENDDDGDDDDDDDDDLSLRVMLPPKSAAPPVSDALVSFRAANGSAVSAVDNGLPIHPSVRTLHHNPTADQLWTPVAGPAHPFVKDGVARGAKNHKLGSVEDAAINPFIFDEQYNTFQAYGYSVDPASMDGGNLVGDAEALEKNGANTVFNFSQKEQRKRKLERKQKVQEEEVEEAKRKEGEEGEAEDEEMTEGIENPEGEAWLDKNWKSPWAGKREFVQGELTEEQKKYAAEHAEKKEKKEKGEKVEVVEKSTFHGKAEVDYQGRSWIEPPKDAKTEVDHTFIPKRWIHSWSGHTKGVSAIRFFPKYGHLLLSASMDTKIKIWDVPGSKKCMRTYMGHEKAVRDISFNNDGTKFLSASYDRKIKYWDTETGKVISTFSTGKIPYVVRLNPDDDKQNLLLAGMSDKKIMQWDMNSGEITQEYDQHLGAVNTITFVDDNRRFVTSSDDKSLRVWEFGIPVVIKYISEPHMHSMPAITLHPNQNWFAAQSLDNQILIYGARDKVRLNKKKRFAGHVIAGYACQVNFSPDGRFIMSGDGEGRCWFWDWKSCKVFRTLKCHEGVCIGCEWHPLEQSKVATCGWDGLIKYWD